MAGAGAGTGAGAGVGTDTGTREQPLGGTEAGEVMGAEAGMCRACGACGAWRGCGCGGVSSRGARSSPSVGSAMLPRDRARTPFEGCILSAPP
jgi:hypothetical protein